MEPDSDIVNHTKPLLLFKYGGNAMTDDSLKERVLSHICSLKDQGYDVVIVHGGGPFIRNILEVAKIESEFIDGHRKTTPEALRYVEMALKGQVNGSLVALINHLGYKGVGLSGKDGNVVIAKKRKHQVVVDGQEKEVDLGQVGDVEKVDTALIMTLVERDYIPVITCLAADSDGNEYNINADMFAGHLAGALGASQFIVLTDVDGLRKDKDNPGTLIPELKMDDIESLQEQKVIQGGMIPKIEACTIALQLGAQSARIINGTKPELLNRLKNNEELGTVIIR